MSKELSKDMSTENQSLYSVLEVAGMLDISKRTVYRYIDKMDSKGVKGYVNGDDTGVTGKYNTKIFINEVGLAYIIKLSSKTGNAVHEVDSVPVKGSLSAETETDSNFELIAFLKEQIANKDKLIESLTTQNYNNQCLLMNLQNQLSLLQNNPVESSGSESVSVPESVSGSESVVKEKRHWWNRR